MMFNIMAYAKCSISSLHAGVQLWHAGFSWLKHWFSWPGVGHRSIPNGHQEHHYGDEGGR